MNNPIINTLKLYILYQQCYKQLPYQIFQIISINLDFISIKTILFINIHKLVLNKCLAFQYPRFNFKNKIILFKIKFWILYIYIQHHKQTSHFNFLKINNQLSMIFISINRQC
ncbi:hypothetical protein TTHERM_000753599 (macronuclear) [Tetrahymena thermophila SB210]|uniref:Uncharacterized protein n=1 Tax=Tetrahymena thermophila (strain SB210) TaxID=312017 RepID=W7X3G2_TETTS|nr:hypothetical protein TTHERM_000753599 [Tetrahymena thermophila SB210]EWS73825.1 hypothetical protein TTHERM_000753599 [Tetrahymena thermophila SB210]|eukprot:XP_012653648.1 hypothetical protein TTHERM_000753599 [Tetrahymena thermophila SB210]